MLIDAPPANQHANSIITAKIGPVDSQWDFVKFIVVL